MKLLLVYPEIESSNTNTSTYSLPLGLGSIATYCKREFGDSLDVKILDGSLMSHDEQLRIIREYSPDVIGVNSTIASQRNSYGIAELAKQLGSKVIFGGVNSTNLWKNLLRNRNFVDGVVLYDGEIPMQLILNRLKESGLDNDIFSGIPNLAYRDSRGNINSPSSILIPSLADLPDIDYSLFNLDRYFKETERRGFGKALTYYAGKGCSKRGNVALRKSYSLNDYEELVGSMDVCTFCGRNELGLRNLPKDREARIVRTLHDKYGVTGFFNVQDTVNLRNSSPIGLTDSWFRIFIGVENIIPENIRRLKSRYGDNLIFQAGVEAANPRMRRAYGKKETSLEDLTKKVEMMRDECIQLHGSFILGGRGETASSMKETTEVARRLGEYDNVTWILISPQLILPGSPDYKALLQMPRMNKKYSKQDLIDIVEINKDFLRYFTPELTREEILEEIKETFNDLRKRNRKDLVLDVKGVVAIEEDYVSPHRVYVTEISS